MRFHLIDGITQYQRRTSIRGYKLCGRTEPYWRQGTIPNLLVVESFCQLAAWLVYLDTDKEKRAILVSFGNIIRCGTAHCGRVEHSVQVESYSSELVAVHGSSTFNGKQVVNVSHLLCALIPAERLESSDSTHIREHSLLKELE